jgi:hypothetical protein
MKRAVADIVGSALFKFNKFPNHINNINAVCNLLYGLRGNHDGENN